MYSFSTDNSIIEQVNFPFWKEKKVNVYVKREDLIDSIVSGNKWRKLKFNILQAKKNRQDIILSFGGAFSNHLHALARLGYLCNIKTIGVVRGNEFKELNKTLLDCKKWGMELFFISRSDYANKKEKWFIEKLRDKFGSCYIVPEGGDNFYGFIGCQEILQGIPNDFSHIFCGLGTGTTFTGLICSNYEADFYGVSALKGDFHKRDIENNMMKYIGNLEFSNQNKINYLCDYHFGGFAKYNSELINFMYDVYRYTSIKLDVVYNAKVWYALNDLIYHNFFDVESKILLIHTGGIQGNRGFGIEY